MSLSNHLASVSRALTSLHQMMHSFLIEDALPSPSYKMLQKHLSLYTEYNGIMGKITKICEIPCMYLKRTITLSNSLSSSSSDHSLLPDLNCVSTYLAERQVTIITEFTVYSTCTCTCTITCTCTCTCNCMFQFSLLLSKLTNKFSWFILPPVDDVLKRVLQVHVYMYIHVNTSIIGTYSDNMMKFIFILKRLLNDFLNLIF